VAAVRLDGRRLKEASEWVGEYQRFWDESFQRLDEVLQDLIQKEKADATEGSTRC